MRSAARLRGGLQLGACGVLLLLFVQQMTGQAIEFSGGASTIYGAAGGTVSLHTRSSDTAIGAGLENHHFSAGGAVERRVRNGTETVGLQQVRADIPTDIFNQTHVLEGLGIGLHVLDGETKRELRGFAGYSSIDGSGSPLFRSGRVDRPAAFGQWSRRISEECQAVTTGLYLRQTTVLESVECATGRVHGMHVALSGGGGSSGFYGAASLSVEQERLKLRVGYIAASDHFDRSTVTNGAMPEPVRENISAEYEISRAWSVTGLHEHFNLAAFTDPEAPVFNTPFERTTLNEGGVQLHARGTSVGVAVVSSALETPASPLPNGEAKRASNVAFSATLQRSFGRLRFTENLVESQPTGAAREVLLLNGVSFRLNPHLLLSESVNVTNGQVSTEHGGELVMAASSVRVDYELLYLANRPQAPFQEAMMVHAGLRLWRSVGLEVASAVSPTGRMGYTARLFAFRTRGGSLVEAGVSGRMGLNVIAGTVLDEAGRPIAGAALLIGAAHVYSDEAGYFQMRERRSTQHTLRVLTDEFLERGTFAVASAPAMVRSREETALVPIRIVVARVSATRAKGASL